MAVLLFSGSLSSTSHASGIKLAWDASEGADGYKIYYGSSSGVYFGYIDVGNVLTYEVLTLNQNENWYFAAMAYNTIGESGYSNEVHFIPKGIIMAPALATMGNILFRFIGDLIWLESDQFSASWYW